MAMFCEKCRAEIPEGSPVCRSCFEPIQPEGFLARLLRLLSGGHASWGKTSLLAGTTVKIASTERIKIRNPLTGVLHEYHSLDEVPVEFREQIQKLREAGAKLKGATSIVVTDAGGKVQTYQSVDELPPNLRALYEQARREKG